MSGVPAAAVLLALAALILPARARQRLAAAGLVCAHRAAKVYGLRWLPWAVPVAAVAAVLLPATALAGATVAVLTALLRHRRGARARRADAESRALAEALDILVAELGAGAHPVAAFRSAAAEADGVVGGALRAVAARAVLGADVGAGLRAVAGASALPAQWHRLAVCWDLAQATGLTMATLMRAAHRDITERLRFRTGVDAIMAGPRATAVVLAGLPLVGVALGQLLGADPVRFLVATDIGGWLLLIGIVLVCAGLLWSDRITRRACR